MTAIVPLDDAWRRRRERPLENAGEVVAYLGLDVPVELIRAAGFSPVRLIAEPRTAGPDDFAEGLGNPVLRGLASALLEGPYRDLKRLVISPTPAAHGWLYNFLRELKSAGQALQNTELFLFDLNHGAAPGLEAARRATVERLQTQLETWSGRSPAADLPGVIADTNATRGLLRRIEGLRAERKLGGAEALAVFGAAEAMTPADYQASLRALIDERKERRGYPGRPCVYSGIETVDARAYLALAAAGRLVVADNQDAGSRSIGPDVAEGGDALAALAERYLHRAPAPAKSPLDARRDYLVGLCRAAGADLVAFNLSPFDHPAGWEVPALREMLAAEGIESEVVAP